MALRAVRFAFILPKGQLLGAGRRTCIAGKIWLYATVRDQSQLQANKCNVPIPPCEEAIDLLLFFDIFK